jgi:hypothetical protein
VGIRCCVAVAGVMCVAHASRAKGVGSAARFCSEREQLVLLLCGCCAFSELTLRLFRYVLWLLQQVLGSERTACVASTRR